MIALRGWPPHAGVCSVALPPGWVLLLGALLLPLMPRRIRSAAFLVFPILALALLSQVPDGKGLSVAFMNYELVLCQADRLSRVFGAIFGLIAFIGGLYAFHVRRPAERMAALGYAGGALGVAFAGDYLTLFIHWEIMAISSTYLIWARETRESEAAGVRYLVVHLVGGVLMLAGILLRLHHTGSLLLTPLPPSTDLSSLLILASVALNAAVPPLHAWLADAYPKASVTGAVFMSALTTKSAVYVLARVFPGWEVLTLFGVAMALYGVFYAVLANDIREILAYHIISQVGYMVAGVGMGTPMALNGATAHAFCHILYKALLFMGAGAVLHTTGRSKLTELGGLARAMPWALALYMIGAFSISGFPLFNGFISKSMVVAAAAEAHRDTVVLLLNLASIGTFLHTGLKLPYFTWFGPPRGIQPGPTPMGMFLGMGLAAACCILLGVAPSLLYQHLPYPAHFKPYTPAHLVETAQLLLFTFFGFWMFRRYLAGEPTVTLDTDWFYRGPARVVCGVLVVSVDRAFDLFDRWALLIVRALAAFARNPLRLLPPFASDTDYSPDRCRPSTQRLLACVLLAFVLLSLWGLYRLAL